MREISAKDITAQVKRLCMEANSYLPEDIKEKINACEQAEPWDLAKNILGIIHENYLIAEKAYVPVCRIPAWRVYSWKIGQDVHIDGNLEEAVNEGVRQGYTEGCLRKSVVRDPLDRVNTTDNTPAMIYYDIVPGDGFKLTVAPKGFGSENMSQIKMLKPSDGLEGVKAFIMKVVEDAGPNPCPPIVVGVGIGGTFDKAALLAKKALMRNTNVRNADPFYAQLEEEMLEKINALGIGPQGVGGKTTALAVNIERCRPTLQVCQSQSTSTAMLPVIKLLSYKRRRLWKRE